jgi:hypothetical protein
MKCSQNDYAALPHNRQTEDFPPGIARGNLAISYQRMSGSKLE